MFINQILLAYRTFAICDYQISARSGQIAVVHQSLLIDPNH
ncbi:hypothetical protein [Nitrosomonas sp.]